MIPQLVVSVWNLCTFTLFNYYYFYFYFIFWKIPDSTEVNMFPLKFGNFLFFLSLRPDSKWSRWCVYIPVKAGGGTSHISWCCSETWFIQLSIRQNMFSHGFHLTSYSCSFLGIQVTLQVSTLCMFCWVCKCDRLFLD